jgi:hypothetical protein
VYRNIAEETGDTPAAMWRTLSGMFLDKQDKDALSNAHTALLQCKQGPEQTFLEHSGNFNHALRLLRDLKDEVVKNEVYVYTLFKQSLNLQYSEILRPLEVTHAGLTYKQAREELLRLELAGQIYTTMSVPSANVAQQQMKQQPKQQGSKQQSGNTQTKSQQKWKTCYNCGSKNHRVAQCPHSKKEENQQPQPSQQSQQKQRQQKVKHRFC